MADAAGVVRPQRIDRKRAPTEADAPGYAEILYQVERYASLLPRWARFMKTVAQRGLNWPGRADVELNSHHFSVEHFR